MCRSLPPNDHFAAEAEVAVKNAADSTLIGLGRLEMGEIVDGVCVFRFDVDLEGEAEFYEIEVGGARDTFRYTLEELEDRLFSLTFTLDG